MRDNEIVTQPIELTGRDPRPDMRRNHVKALSRQPAGRPHAGEVLDGVDCNPP
jgi:hypothetical protein